MLPWAQYLENFCILSNNEIDAKLYQNMNSGFCGHDLKTRLYFDHLKSDESVD